MEDSHLGGNCRVVDSVWCGQSGGHSGVFMFLRRPERIVWYLWTVLRSQLEEGADSEEELWITDESDTEESDSGGSEEELWVSNESDTEESESDSGDGENEEREGSRETKREEERDFQRE